MDDQFKKLDAILSNKKIKDLHQQCLIDYKKCIDNNKPTDAVDIANEVRRKREANKNSRSMKLLNIVSTTYLFALLGTICFSIASTFLPKKIIRYFRSRKKISVGQILEQHIKSKKINFPKDIKESMDECSKISEKRNSKQADSRLLRYPQDWEHADLANFNDVTARKAPKRKKQRQRTITETIKDMVTPQNEIPEMPWGVEIPINHQCVKPIYRRNFVPTDKDTNKKNIVAYAFFDPSSDSIKSSLPDEAIKKMQSIHEDGRYASHEKSATGYKCFKYKGSLLWEFKVAGDERLYGATIPANNEGKKSGVAPLVIFDTLLNKKL